MNKPCELVIVAVMNAIYATSFIETFNAQLVRASDGCREVTGSNPVEVLTLSGFYIHHCINCVHNCEDHSLLDLTSAFLYMKHYIYHFTNKTVFHLTL